MEVVSVGEGITFGTNGTAQRYLGQGWASPPDNPILTWTVDHVATIEFRMPAARSTMSIAIRATPFLGNDALPHQDVQVYINGLWASFARLTQPETIQFQAPRDAIIPRGNLLALVIPTATSPLKLGLSEDQRKLGLAVEKIDFDVQ